MAKNSEKVIANFVNGLFMTKLIREKGWSKQDAAYAAAEFLTCGKAISAYDFFHNYELKTVVTH